jgi:hypothetical protein
MVERNEGVQVDVFNRDFLFDIKHVLKIHVLPNITQKFNN